MFRWAVNPYSTSKNYSEYSESGNPLIFLICYGPLASMNRFLVYDSIHKWKNTEWKSLHPIKDYLTINEFGRRGLPYRMKL